MRQTGCFSAPDTWCSDLIPSSRFHRRGSFTTSLLLDPPNLHVTIYKHVGPRRSLSPHPAWLSPLWGTSVKCCARHVCGGTLKKALDKCIAHASPLLWRRRGPRLHGRESRQADAGHTGAAVRTWFMQRVWRLRGPASVPPTHPSSPTLPLPPSLSLYSTWTIAYVQASHRPHVAPLVYVSLFKEEPWEGSWRSAVLFFSSHSSLSFCQVGPGGGFGGRTDRGLLL